MNAQVGFCVVFSPLVFYFPKRMEERGTTQAKQFIVRMSGHCGLVLIIICYLSGK